MRGYSSNGTHVDWSDDSYATFDGDDRRSTTGFALPTDSARRITGRGQVADLHPAPIDGSVWPDSHVHRLAKGRVTGEPCGHTLQRVLSCLPFGPHRAFVRAKHGHSTIPQPCEDFWLAGAEQSPGRLRRLNTRAWPGAYMFVEDGSYGVLGLVAPRRG